MRPEWPALVFWLTPNMVRWLSDDTSARLSWFYDPQIWPIPNHSHLLKQTETMTCHDGWPEAKEGSFTMSCPSDKLLSSEELEVQLAVGSWQDCTLLFSAFLSTSSYTTSHHYSLVCLLVHTLIHMFVWPHLCTKIHCLTTSNTNPQFKSTFSLPGACSGQSWYHYHPQPCSCHRPHKI